MKKLLLIIAAGLGLASCSQTVTLADIPVGTEPCQNRAGSYVFSTKAYCATEAKELQRMAAEKIRRQQAGISPRAAAKQTAPVQTAQTGTLQQYQQVYRNIYPQHTVLKIFNVKSTARNGTGTEIRAEIFQLYLSGIGGNLASGRYTPNQPMAIADATDTAARTILTDIQTVEKRGNNRFDALAILKKGNLLNGEQLIMVNNRVAARCQPNGSINSFGEALWSCQRAYTPS